ncbi:trifunctional serine/threonine-protein kinase/ATP-binding protein/sensor histidine kinase [Roseofilum casamattae]|uniref:histidine kinase n=1 Tax=Roseofilum casamattae BLCC-M143 TaxID=3022442 RepID=A0ABT7BW28_9CYAN|nr:ATP-binding sensor histidine kinase [Roseofilum casamattae]MDJ1182468.1 AAA family ATPase [Roseofilum casamattae BLCC-M143]
MIPELASYQIGENIYEGTRTLVYRGIRRSDSQKVVIKFLRNSYPSFSELVQFRNQYAIAKNLDSAGILQPLSLERYGNGYALVMEDLGAISLDKILAKEELDLGRCLDIAIQLAEILQELDRQRVIHKDIKPGNILICPETQQVKLIDFSIASLLPREAQEIKNFNVLEGTLAYISPEQTGRMNRGIDYRSDFYSLGVTFYELLAGRLPFNNDDPMELVHAHIAQQPIPPSNWLNGNGENYPQSLSDIILKLMAKNAEDRYQSALGLKYDLEKCRRQYQETGEIVPFVLGERDICDRFLLPEKLYGREKEVQTLLDAFERVAAGQTEMMLVAGFSGIGKTAVVNEVHKPIVRQKGYFIKGKFDQFNRNIPFSAFVQAFRDLMEQLLGESDTQLQEWKTQILAAVGENGQVLVDVIPELKQIIGEQSPVPELSGSASQNRFNLLFEKFIAVFTTQEHPLTLFLDDLQWADSASLNLLKILMGDNQTGYLLLLGAYRDNEVFPAHPLMLTLGKLEQQNTTISTITLTPLSVLHINQLVAETLSCSQDLATPLTDLVYQKTKGNPFFTTQFLKGLHEDDLITFNRNLGYWECDLVKVRDATLTDDVVEFMAGRLHKLPKATQNILKLAACIGNQFELETLAVICENPAEEVAADLWNALREGLILPQSETYKFFQGWEGEKEQAEGVTVGYRFLHDRVQQAAYSLIPEDQRKGTHFNIGTLLLEKIPEAQLEEEIFTITSHLNRGIELIPTPERQLQLCELNLLATQKAKSSTAYTAAWEYVETGIQLLEKSSWQTYYDLTLNLYTEAVEVAYLKSDFETMEQMVEIVFSQAHHILDQVKVYEMQVQRLSVQNQFIAAIEVALGYLKLLGVDLPLDPTVEEVETWLENTNRAVDKMSDEAMIELPEMTNQEMKAAMEIISRLIGPCYFFRPNLLAISACQSVLLSLEYGNTLDTPPALSMYATALCNVNDISRAYRSGSIGVKILQKQHKNPRKTLAFNMFYAHVFHWSQHYRHSIDPLYEAYQSGIDVGELEFASYALTSHVDCRYCAGEELSGLIPDFKRSVEFCYSNQLEGTGFYTASVLQTAYNLIHASEEPWCLQGEFYDETTVIESFHKNRNITGLAIHHFNKIYLSYLFEGDLESLFEAEQYLYGIQGHLLFPIFNFVGGLAYLSLAGKAIGEERYQYLERAKKYSDLLKFWAGHAPMNFQHKSDLMQAETCRVLGQKLEAIALYDRAIAGAKENGYIQEEALANELFAKFYLDWDFGFAQSKGREKYAAVHMQEAYYCYAQWGAKAKTSHLERTYPQLLTPILQQPQRPLTESLHRTISCTTTGTGSLFDLTSLMKASRTLSEEIDLDRVIANLMQVVRENAGAETVALMLWHEGILRLEALIANEISEAIDPIPVEESDRLPLTLINQVKRTQQPLILDNARQETHGTADPYLQTHQLQSVLCLPLIDRGQLIGILYLENNQVSGAFTSDRVEILQLLCSQAAISLENARLYRQAQNALTDLQQAQLQMVQQEKMAALGNLVAGVAHEINNPLGFIGGNVGAAQEYLQDLLEIVSLYQENTSPPEEIAEEIEDLDPEFIAEDFPKLIASMQTGCDRIRNISTSLRTFSRTDTDAKTEFNLYEGLDSTLLILKYRLKANEQRPAIEIVKKYGEIPEVKCYAGQINQVFMNLLANAIDALDEGNLGKTYEEIEKAPNCITVCTELSENKKNVLVKIADNGTGMPETVKEKIFEQGFTTKGVGKGTGLGMAIAHQIITEKHGGAIACQSELGKGTEFIISLSIG